ncbi:hypothetical protein DI270_035115 [Microbispora triticiradicis]|uniref:Uncharacterized protein n=1 Tax=Microbispora triticiradicis TaxID=2200763 RepID=A0ABX9L9N3_9ACTN|nr:hypothetical protein DI270_035115 [Microbispora triticiradicis]
MPPPGTDGNGPSATRRRTCRSCSICAYPGIASPRQVGGETILELWVPAGELDELNAHISGVIEVVHEFRPERDTR